MPQITSEHKLVFKCIEGKDLNIIDCINPIIIPEIGKEYVWSSIVDNTRYKFIVKDIIIEFHDNFANEQIIYIEYETVKEAE